MDGQQRAACHAEGRHPPGHRVITEFHPRRTAANVYSLHVHGHRAAQQHSRLRAPVESAPQGSFRADTERQRQAARLEVRTHDEHLAVMD
jgi:hypothetical protein